jgi:hypothetical protein
MGNFVETVSGSRPGRAGLYNVGSCEVEARRFRQQEQPKECVGLETFTVGQVFSSGHSHVHCNRA